MFVLGFSSIAYQVVLVMLGVAVVFACVSFFAVILECLSLCLLVVMFGVALRCVNVFLFAVMPGHLWLRCLLSLRVVCSIASCLLLVLPLIVVSCLLSCGLCLCLVLSLCVVNVMASCVCQCVFPLRWVMHCSGQGHNQVGVF